MQPMHVEVSVLGCRRGGIFLGGGGLYPTRNYAGHCFPNLTFQGIQGAFANMCQNSSNGFFQQFYRGIPPFKGIQRDFPGPFAIPG